MKTIVLLACVATKADSPQQAQNLYISALFKKSLNYGKSLHPDAMYILSAKHYLLPLEKVIAPYNMTLNDFDADEKKAWAQTVLKLLQKRGHDLQRDKFIFLAGKAYRKYLEPEIRNFEVPMENLRIGQQMSWLDKQVKRIKEILRSIKNIIYETIGKNV